MAATGKKGKKAKWKQVNITDYIAEPTTVSTVQNWAESVDDETENYGYSTRQRAPVVLPSASRAARGGMAVDDESIPKRPPYVAYISNLPYDVDESAVSELFSGLKIQSLRLPREGDRLKGNGYVDFEDRESLINAMNIPDLTISGRRIRIEVSTHDNQRMGNRGRSDRDRDYDPERTMGDWRSGPRAMPEPAQRSSRPMDRERERESSADNRPGGWRDAGRDSYGRDRHEDRERGFGREGERERGGYGGRDGFRTAERFSRDSNRGFGERRGFGDRDREPPPKEESKPRERPKLNLLPRTVPREIETPSTLADGAIVDEKPAEKAAPKPVSAEKVFGAAKPVDTAAKEREIEERLRKQEEEARRLTEEKERWSKKSDDSGDRRGGPRKDDYGRDSRSYNKDKRDYSRDDKRDRRDDSNRRSDSDRRDDSNRRDIRDRRDDCDRRDDRDNRDRRDDPDDRDRRDDHDNRDRRDDPDDRGRRDDRDYRDDHDRRDDRDRNDDHEHPRDDRGHRNDRERSGGREADHNNKHTDDKETNGKDRQEDCERPMPKLKEQEKPNFIASNKFSFLEDADDAGSD